MMKQKSKNIFLIIAVLGIIGIIFISGCVEKEPVVEKATPETTPPIIPTREPTEEKIIEKYYPTYFPEGWELLTEKEAKDKMSLPVDNQYHDVTLTVLMYGKNVKEGELPSPYVVPENADALISIRATVFEEEGLVDRMKTEWWEEAFAGKTETKTNYDKELWCVSKSIKSVKAEGCIIFCDSKTVIEAMSYRKLEPGEPEPPLQKECTDIIKSIRCA